MPLLGPKYGDLIFFGSIAFICCTIALAVIPWEVVRYAFAFFGAIYGAGFVYVFFGGSVDLSSEGSSRNEGGEDWERLAPFSDGDGDGGGD